MIIRVLVGSGFKFDSLPPQYSHNLLWTRIQIIAPKMGARDPLFNHKWVLERGEVKFSRGLPPKPSSCTLRYRLLSSTPLPRMVMTDHSDFLSQEEVESSVQSRNQQHPDSHELPSLDRQSSIFSLTLDEFQHTFSGDIGSLGSMNIEELLNNILAAEEIQAYDPTLVPNPRIAPSTELPVAAATVPTANIHPQFPGGEINTPTVNDTAIQQSLLRQGSLTVSSPLSQKTMDEVWYEIQKFQQEQEYVISTANVQEVNSVQCQTTYEEMTLEDFLIRTGVVRAHDNPPSGEVQYGGKMQNNTCQGNNVGANQSNNVNNVNMGVNVAERCSGPVEKVDAKKLHRMIKNRESAARSRARRQAYTRDLEAELSVLKKENARLQQDLEEIKRTKQQSMEEFMKARVAKDGKKGLKRSWSCMF